MHSKMTSVAKVLQDVKNEVENERKKLVDDVKKTSKKDLMDLPENLTQKERVDYIHKVQPHFDQIYKLACEGFTKADIADTLGITQVAFRHMTREIGELKVLLDIAAEVKVDRVEQSLYQVATGYEVEEEVINPFSGKKERLVKYQAPVLGAIKYVLSNKRGEEYADKKQIIRKVELGADVQQALLSMSVEDLQRTLSIAKSSDAVDAVFVERGDADGSPEED